MNKNISALQEFLEDRGGSYQNHHHIDFDLMDDAIMASYTADQGGHHQKADFFLFYETAIRQVMTDLAIKTPSDLDLIMVDQLWNLFSQGKANIYCGLHFNAIYYTLYFRWEDEKLYSIDSARVKQKIAESLTTMDDFTSYTNRQFQNSSSATHKSSSATHRPL
jgi:hypothetical protein